MMRERAASSGVTQIEAMPAAHLSLEQLALARKRTRAARAAGEAAGDGWSDGMAPLSLAQERMWLLGQVTGDGPASVLTCAVRLAGRLDVAALERSLDAVVQRHESLRTTFVERDGRPWQLLREAVPTSLPVSGVKAKAEAASADEWAMYLRYRTLEEARRPFDLARGPLLRGRLLRVDPSHHLLLLTLHRLVCDERSLQVVLDELARFYSALATGRASEPLPPPLQYAAYSARQRKWLESEAADRRLAYWQRQLANLEPVRLPVDRPAARSLAADRLERAVPQPVVDRLRNLARRERATLFMTLLAAWQTLLALETGRRDVAVGSPVTAPDAAELIGCCTNLIVLRADLGGDPTFLEIVRRVRRTALDAYAHQDAPIERVAASMRLGGNPGRAPLVATTFSLHGPPAAPLAAGPVTFERLPAADDRADVDLAVVVAERDDGLRLTATYANDLYDRASIAARFDRFARLLETVAADPAIRLGQLGAAIGAPAATGSALGGGSALTLRLAPQEARSPASFRTPTEAAVAEIWRQVLGVERVGAEDDFFELGGHSLQAAQAIARLRDALGVAAPMRGLFESPTLAAFARRIDALLTGAQATSPAAMVTLQPGGARRPVFLVPGGAGGGSALFRFAKLARHVGADRPFFGFLAAEVDERDDPQRWVEATAAAYVRELRRRQPGGPYLLLGACVGGIVTLAMAQCLCAEGEPAPHVLLLDSRNPASIPSGAASGRDFRNRSGAPERAARRADDAGLRAPRVRLLNRSTPAPYPGRITLFANEEWMRADPTLGWGGVALDGLETRRLPGQHGTYLREHTAALADLLRPLLDAVEAEAERERLD